MPLPSFSEDIEKNIIRHIKYRGTIRTGEIIVDNGDGTYDVKIALSDVVYPSIETIHYEMVFAVGEMAVLAFEYGSKESPKIIGHGKKIAQTPVEVEVDYSGTARVETLDAYSIAGATAYLEGRIYLGGAGNCTKRGFHYGTTISYGSYTQTEGSYGSGSYAIKVEGLTGLTTYHFRAYIIDANEDTQYGDDKTFTTLISPIDVGAPAVSTAQGVTAANTHISKINPANANGYITTVEIYAHETITGCKVATFFEVSPGYYSTRDWEAIGTIASGSKITKTVNIEIEIGDLIGWCGSSGYICMKYAAGEWDKEGDYIPCNNTQFYSRDKKLSLYGSHP